MLSYLDIIYYILNNVQPLPYIIRGYLESLCQYTNLFFNIIKDNQTLPSNIIKLYIPPLLYLSIKIYIKHLVFLLYYI